MIKSKIAPRLLDAAIAAFVIFTAWRVVQWAGYVGNSADRAAQLIRPQSTLQLSSIPWGEASRHLILVASTTCEACRESVGFYKRLSDSVRLHPGFRFTVISPERVDQVWQWLKTNDISPHDVIQVRDPVSLGLSLTPTLLFVNARGRVTDVMLRRLSATEETQVLQRLAAPSSAAVLDNTDYTPEIDEAQLRTLWRTARPTIIDIHDRDVYARKHGDRSINIPRDELAVRAGGEVSTSTPVVIDCADESLVACRSAGRILQASGFSRVFLLVP